MSEQTQYTQDDIQKIRAQLQEEVDNLLSKGCWVIASYTGVRYIGMVSKTYSNDKSYSLNDWVQNPKYKQDVIRSMPGYIELDPVFDYLIQLGPGQVPGDLSKTPTILPIDMTRHITPTVVYCPHLIFFSDLQEDDLQTYKGLVQNGLVMTRRSKLVPHDPTAGASGPRIISPEQAAREMAQLQGQNRR